MEMKMKTLITVTITAIALLGPFVFVLIKNQRKNSKTKSIFKKYTNVANSNIDESDTLDNTAIGIDYNQNRLYFIKHSNNKESEQIIDLNDVKSVKLLNGQRSMKSGKSSTLIIEKIEILLTSNSPDKQDHILELYDENIQMTLSGEVQLANKWVAILERVLKQNQS